MHELSIAQEIVALVGERVRGTRVRRIVLEIGRVSGVLPDALRFGFDLCCAGTVLDGAELVIEEPPGRARCRGCGAELHLDRPFGVCACGGADLEWLSGGELRIRQLELC